MADPHSQYLIDTDIFKDVPYYLAPCRKHRANRNNKARGSRVVYVPQAVKRHTEFRCNRSLVVLQTMLQSEQRSGSHTHRNLKCQASLSGPGPGPGPRTLKGKLHFMFIVLIKIMFLQRRQSAQHPHTCNCCLWTVSAPSTAWSSAFITNHVRNQCKMQQPKTISAIA